MLGNPSGTGLAAPPLPPPIQNQPRRRSSASGGFFNQILSGLGFTDLVPFKQAAAFSLLDWGLNAVFQDPRRKAMQEVVAAQLARQQELDRQNMRRARGEFTPAETQSIREGSRAQVDAISEGVGARGLGASGAGASVVADAQQAPFLMAQAQAQAALQQYPGVNWELLNTGPSQITQMLGSIMGQYQQLSAMDKNDPVIKDFENYMMRTYGAGMEPVEPSAYPPIRRHAVPRAPSTYYSPPRNRMTPRPITPPRRYDGVTKPAADALSQGYAPWWRRNP